MTRESVWKYTCDFCGKSGLSASHMARHEVNCTLNPARSCGMCKMQGADGPRPMRELLALVPSRQELGIEEDLQADNWSAQELAEKLAPRFPPIIERLKNATADCPACIMAAFRQKRIPLSLTGWDYKKAREQFWTAWNDAQE